MRWLIGADASAQPAKDYPDKPVRWVLPFTPGGSNDVIARLIARMKLLDAWGQQFIIDNRPGAGGLIGADTVAKAAPDGYTLLLSNPGPNVNSPLLSKKSPYKVEDFAPVVFFGYAPLLILANPALPVRNPKELVEYMKTNQGKINWGSSGTGSSLHIGLAVLQAATGLKVTHIPYKGSAPALTDLIGGQIQFMHTTTVSAESQIKAGTRARGRRSGELESARRCFPRCPRSPKRASRTRKPSCGSAWPHPPERRARLSTS